LFFKEDFGELGLEERFADAIKEAIDKPQKIPLYIILYLKIYASFIPSFFLWYTFYNQ